MLADWPNLLLFFNLPHYSSLLEAFPVPDPSCALNPNHPEGVEYNLFTTHLLSADSPQLLASHRILSHSWLRGVTDI